MQDYRRYRVAGETYFFAVNLLERYPNDLLVRHIDLLRSVVAKVRQKRPFHIDAWVILPDHLHCVWTLPEGNSDFAMRWALIKAGFSRRLPKDERRNKSRISKGERGIWQRQYWEHFISDDMDYARHADYIHYNPVKHGYVRCAKDWPYSSFHRYVRLGVLSDNWAGGADAELETGECG